MKMLFRLLLQILRVGSDYILKPISQLYQSVNSNPESFVKTNLERECDTQR